MYVTQHDSKRYPIKRQTDSTYATKAILLCFLLLVVWHKKGKVWWHFQIIQKADVFFFALLKNRFAYRFHFFPDSESNSSTNNVISILKRNDRLLFSATLSRDKIDMRPDFKLITPFGNYTLIMRHFETNFPFPPFASQSKEEGNAKKNKIYIVKNIMASSSKESTNKRYSAFSFTQFSLHTVLFRVHVEEAELGMGAQREIATRLKGDVLREVPVKCWKLDRNPENRWNYLNLW